MPGFTDWQAAEERLGGEEPTGNQHGEQTARQAEDGEQWQPPQAGERLRRYGEERAVPEQHGVDPAGHAGRDDEGDERPRRELEQQQLDGEYDGGERSAERGRHAGGRTAGE